MSRFCHINAPKRCELLAIKYFADELGEDKYCDDLTDEQKSEICRLCSEDLIGEAEYYRKEGKL